MDNPLQVLEQLHRNNILFYLCSLIIYIILFGIFILVNHFYLNDLLSLRLSLIIFFIILISSSLIIYRRISYTYTSIYSRILNRMEQITWNQRLNKEDVERNLTETYTIDSSDISTTEICFCQEDNVDDVIIKTNCGHYFHAKCLASWLVNQNTCPMCREKILDPTSFN